MKNNIKKIGIGIVTVSILFGTNLVFSEPGTITDPLVTLSYVEEKIEEVKDYIDEKLSKVNSSVDNSSESNKWVVVEVPTGKSLIAKDGTEIILRSGNARAIAVVVNGIMNGLTNVTEGRDLAMEETITANHLLIVPRDDGRGIRALSHCFVLVKGDYEIK